MLVTPPTMSVADSVYQQGRFQLSGPFDWPRGLSPPRSLAATRKDCPKACRPRCEWPRGMTKPGGFVISACFGVWPKLLSSGVACCLPLPLSKWLSPRHSSYHHHHHHIPLLLTTTLLCTPTHSLFYFYFFFINVNWQLIRSIIFAWTASCYLPNFDLRFGYSSVVASP